MIYWALVMRDVTWRCDLLGTSLSRSWSCHSHLRNATELQRTGWLKMAKMIKSRTINCTRTPSDERFHTMKPYEAILFMKQRPTIDHNKAVFYQVLISPDFNSSLRPVKADLPGKPTWVMVLMGGWQWWLNIMITKACYLCWLMMFNNAGH